MFSNPLSKIKKSAIFGIVLCICAAGGAVYRHAHQTHTAVISLTYQSASRGLYPDGMRCDPYLATSEEVLARIDLGAPVVYRQRRHIRHGLYDHVPGR